MTGGGSSGGEVGGEQAEWQAGRRGIGRDVAREMQEFAARQQCRLFVAEPLLPLRAFVTVLPPREVALPDMMRQQRQDVRERRRDVSLHSGMVGKRGVARSITERQRASNAYMAGALAQKTRRATRVR